MKKITTLVVVHDNEQVLLGMKKIGFGAGLWNGFGGKVEPRETIEQAATRELTEESGLTTNTLTSRGVVEFTFRDTDLEIQMNIFATQEYAGELVETLEMRPQWFAHHAVPYHEMWADDIHWLPHVLQGKSVIARFHFDNPDTQSILHKEIIIHE